VKLRVLSPTQVEVDEEVAKVLAEGADGAFALLPRHADFVTALVPGLLLYETGGDEQALAINGGTLVKCGDEVLVSTPEAARGRDLGELNRAVEEAFEKLTENERRARAAMQKIEADLVRRFVELQEHGG